MYAQIYVERIHFQKHPDQSDEYHHLSHEGYGQQLFLYPKTLHWSGDLELHTITRHVPTRNITQICKWTPFTTLKAHSTKFKVRHIHSPASSLTA